MIQVLKVKALGGLVNESGFNQNPTVREAMEVRGSRKVKEKSLTSPPEALAWVEKLEI